MEIITFLILGGFAGWIASIIVGTNARQGLMGDIILGILGAVVGGMIMNMVGSNGVTGLNVYSVIVAVIGSIVLIGLGRIMYR